MQIENHLHNTAVLGDPFGNHLRQRRGSGVASVVKSFMARSERLPGVQGKAAAPTVAKPAGSVGVRAAGVVTAAPKNPPAGAAKAAGPVVGKTAGDSGSGKPAPAGREPAGANLAAQLDQLRAELATASPVRRVEIGRLAANLVGIRRGR